MVSADEIKQIRIDNGMTMQELANVLWVSVASISRWERGFGGPGPETVERLKKLVPFHSQEVERDKALEEWLNGWVARYT